MNERIRQLAEEATEFQKIPYGGIDGVFREAFVFNKEKFAELLVRECAELAKNKSMSIVNKAELYVDDADEIDTARATAWQFLVLEAEIKKHFGVKE